MDRLEKVLKDIKIAEVEPSEELVSLTKLECRKTIRNSRKEDERNAAKRSRMTVRLLAAAAFVALVFVVLVVSTITSRSPIEGAAYYTIDINPSFGFLVDEENVVLEVKFQNEDAQKLYEGMNCVGLKLHDAIRLIVNKALASGYIKEGSDNYVLLGQFLGDESKEDGQEQLNHLVAALENELGDGVKLIGVKGNSKDLGKAEDLEVSAGMLILCELVEGVEAEDGVKVADVVKYLPEKMSEPEFKAPVIEGSTKEDMLIISWAAIDFSNVLIDGAEIEYKLLKGKSVEEIKEMKNVVVSQNVRLADAQPTSFTVGLNKTEMNEDTYYCLYVHCSNTSKLSNVLPVKVMVAEQPTKEPQITPEPIDSEDDEFASTISGSITGDEEKIYLSWSGIDNERFSGYKVMYSYTDSTPTYGEDGCHYLEYVTNADKTSGTYRLSNLYGYREGRKFYFSITALYDNQQTKVAGNVITRTMPTTTPNTTEPPQNTDYPSTNITGYRDGDKIYLSWGKINDSRLEGYKVVYSFTDSTPVYGSSSHIRWITNPSETATVIKLSELGSSSDERTCYFSITALYEDHSVKRPGNAVGIVIPPVTVPEYVGTNLTYAEYNADTQYVSLSWNAIDHPNFEGYKVMYSFTDTEPVYGDGSKYMAWITNASTTSYAIKATSLTGYEPGATGYFSITVLYDSHSVKVPGNVKSITFPVETTPTPPPTPTPTLSYAFCSEENGVVYMEWSGVEHELFEYYKVTCTVGGSSNVFNVGNATSFSKTANQLSGFSDGATCTFTVTAVFSNDDHNQSNSISDVLCNPPAPDPTPTPTLSSATCSSEGVVSVTWSAVSHEDFVKYIVYCKIGDTTSSDIVEGEASTSWTQSAIELSGFEEGATGTFWVVAVFSNGDNNASGTGSATLTAGPA